MNPEESATSEQAGSGRIWPPAEGTRVRAPLPHLAGDYGTQLFVRGPMWLFRNRLELLSGIEHIAVENDPFIVAANHSQRADAVLLPALLFYHRGGKRVHFMADWPMMLIPGIGYMYRCGQIIPVFGKKPKVRLLAGLRRFYMQPGTAWQRAGKKLEEGASIGVFPESTVNRDPKRLLRGRLGAARLAVEHQVPVVPVGIRFPQHQEAERIPDGAPMQVEIGAPLVPPDQSHGSSKELVSGFQTRIMERLSELSGKSWSQRAPRRRVDGS